MDSESEEDSNPENLLGAIEDFLSSHSYKRLINKLKNVKSWNGVLENLIRCTSSKSKNHIEAVKMLIASLLKEKLVEPKKFNEILRSLLVNLESPGEMNFTAELLYDLLRNQHIAFYDLLCIVKPLFEGSTVGKNLMLDILAKMFNEIDAFGNLENPLAQTTEKNVIIIDFPGNGFVKTAEKSNGMMDSEAAKNSVLKRKNGNSAETSNALDFNELLKGKEMDSSLNMDKKNSNDQIDNKTTKVLNSLPGTSKNDLRYYEPKKTTPVSPDLDEIGAASLDFQMYYNLHEFENPLAQLLSNEAVEKIDPNTWACADCTFRNQNSWSNCEICRGTKPDHDLNNYRQLCDLENGDIVPNLEAVECPICFTECKAYEGVTLRDCLHVFCKECLNNHVKVCTDLEVKCPFANENYSCDSILQDREIRAVVSDAIYEKYLENRLKLAQPITKDSFPCKAPNCKGWWIYDPFDLTVTNVSCPVCHEFNCLMCKEIHPGLDCTQYQNLLKVNAGLRETDKLIKDMVIAGEAINCPQCQVRL